VPSDAQGVILRELGKVERDADGEQVYRWFHGRAAELTLRDCTVPSWAVCVPDAEHASSLRGRGSPVVQALDVGVGRAAYEAALEYARLRVQGGRRIIEHQAIGTLLAEMAIRIELARNIVWKAAWAADHPDEYASISDLPLQTVAEAYTSEAMHHVALLAAECFGAMGVMKDMPLQKYVHDTLAFLHAGTSNSTAKLRIAEAIAQYRRT
jgi:alkylation response protein AidB-like acyl-CoA dehydrogenase